MNFESHLILISLLFGAAVLGLYYGFNKFMRKWLGVESYGVPLPAIIRWTMLIGSIMTIFFGLWIGTIVVGHKL